MDLNVTKEEILKKINDIFIDILDNENIILTLATTANDVEDWDSLNHIQLVVAIEKQFKIRFTSQQILNWENVETMIDCIISKDV
jgi:acyl carrier protein